MTASLSRRALGAAAAGLLAAPSLAQALPVLRIGNQKGGLRSLIEASGAGRDLPYRIEWSEFPAAAPLLEALNAGALDLGYQGDLAFLTVFAAGAPLRGIGVARPSPAGQGILVRDDRIRSLADLRGRRIAGNRGGWGHYLIRAALKREGIGPEEVQVTFLPPTDALLAFRSGAVDAWAVWEPYISVEIQQFGARTLIDGRGLTPSIMIVSAHEQAIRTRRPQLADFLRRFAAGWDWARDNIAEYARYNSALTRIPEAALVRAYGIEATAAAPLDDALVREFQLAADQAVEFGLLRDLVDVRRALHPIAPAVAG
ncbi:ABC transporter substrate-binding protein [Paracraurococcus ruber]|uniref:ABC transporter substrate-binding protein n=1 Tax=Paracraurococcus ruber TaxID=77675 RepID=A0ABS1CQF9_9PROT|nr:ABC transporter substrate-binding protein [Paracraurococcus ruber]MBK1656648.1 ABC transporter substrate-binding protein [Paracraurococcus ruber]TDG33729.1 ABC transporter substrate-binding protein [Paracraurococcus ruber]